jgi:hypothetical protein
MVAGIAAGEGLDERDVDALAPPEVGGVGGGAAVRLHEA